MNRLNNNDDEKLGMSEQWLSTVVDELKQPLSYQVSGELRSIRREVLLRAEKPPRPFFNLVWGVPALASVFAVIMSVNLWQQPDKEAVRVPQAESVVLEDISILKASDDIEFFQNLELLQWMGQVDDGLSKG